MKLEEKQTVLILLRMLQVTGNEKEKKILGKKKRNRKKKQTIKMLMRMLKTAIWIMMKKMHVFLSTNNCVISFGIEGFPSYVFL